MDKNKSDEKKGEERKYWIALNQAKGMTAELFYHLVERFGSPAEAWSASDREIKKVFFGKSKYVYESIIELRKSGEDGTRETERAKELGAGIITLLDDDYPAMLREIPKPPPPPVLYYKGTLSKQDDEWSVAIVGTRRCTGYGSAVAFDLARNLCNRGYTIVSGMAAGIDTAAHKGALKAGGRTVAVFGTSIDKVFPANNLKLAKKIKENGLVLSEFPVGAFGDKLNFPRRNRIISGMSKGIIVVEAGIKSGALITAELAVEQGKEVLAIPGDIHTSVSRGPHWLIKHGAYLVESADDVLEILGCPKGQVELGFEEDIQDGNQKKAYEIVSRAPAGFDEICAALDAPVSEVTAGLMMLQMKGLIRELPGKIYVAVSK